MKHKVIALTAALSMLGGSIAALPAMAAEQTLLNENFNSGTVGSWTNNYWYDYLETNLVPDPENNENTCFNVTDRINEQSALRWFLEPNGKTLTENTTYTATAKVYVPQQANLELFVAAKINCNKQGVSGNAHQWGHPDKVYGITTLATTGNKWEEITVTFTPNTIYSSENLPTDEWTDEELSFDNTFLSIRTTDSNTSFYVDDISITYDDGTTVNDAVAQVGDDTFTSLDAAINAATYNDTVTVLKDTELSSVVTKPITLNGAAGATKPTVTVTAATGNNVVLFGDNTTLENITLSRGTDAATSDTAQYGALIGYGKDLTIKSSTIQNLAFNQTSYGKFDFDDVNFTGIYRNGWFLSTTGDSTLNKVTATDNNFVESWVGFIATGGGVTTTLTNCTIKNNNGCRAIWTENNNGSVTVLNGGNTLAEVALGVGALTINETVPMSNIDIDYPNSYILTLGTNFAGNLTVPLTEETAVANKTVANVVSGANTDGITVTGMDTENTVLKVDADKLVIAEKTAPASYTTKVGAAEVRKGTGEFANTVATGFRATVTNNGGTQGTFDNVRWNVKSANDTKTTGYQEMKTTVTLPPGANAEIFLIVDGLGDKNATATVEIK